MFRFVLFFESSLLLSWPLYRSIAFHSGKDVYSPEYYDTLLCPRSRGYLVAAQERNHEQKQDLQLCALCSCEIAFVTGFETTAEI